MLLQGRGLHTHAFTHAMEHDHHVFMKLEDGTVWCLPDGYQVEDRSLDVIRYVLNPLYSGTQVGLLCPFKLKPQLHAYTYSAVADVQCSLR